MVESGNGFLVAEGCACGSTTHAAEEGGSLHGQVMAETMFGGQLDDECARRRLVRTRSQRHRARRYARLVLRCYRLACGEVHPPGLGRDWREEEDDHHRHDANEHDQRTGPAAEEDGKPYLDGGKLVQEGETCKAGPEPASDGPDDCRDPCPKHDVQSRADVDEGPVRACAAAGDRLMTSGRETERRSAKKAARKSASPLRRVCGLR